MKCFESHWRGGYETCLDIVISLSKNCHDFARLHLAVNSLHCLCHKALPNRLLEEWCKLLIIKEIEVKSLICWLNILFHDKHSLGAIISLLATVCGFTQTGPVSL